MSISHLSIIDIHVSRENLHQSFNPDQTAQEIIAEQYPDQDVHNVDGLLSNISETPLILNDPRSGREVSFPSAEVFIQIIKSREGDPQRKEFRKKEARDAKYDIKPRNREMAQHLDQKNESVEYVYWGGQKIPYCSPEHLSLIKQALEAKFAQNPEAREQLLATGNRRLVHVTGYEKFQHDKGFQDKPYTSLPADNFVGILTEIRGKYQYEERLKGNFEEFKSKAIGWMSLDGEFFCPECRLKFTPGFTQEEIERGTQPLVLR